MAEVSYKVQTRDISTGDLWEFEKFTGLTFNIRENAVGTCVFTVPSDDAKLSSTSVSETKLQEIRIYRDDTLFWQGFIASIDDTADSTTVYGLTFLEALKWYRTAYNSIYTNKKIGTEIISPIWNAIVARTNPLLGTYIAKGTIQDPYQVGTTTAKTVSKTLMDEDFFSFLIEMVALSRADSPSGSWKQDTVFEITSSTTPTFNFWRNVGTNQVDVVWRLDSEIVDFTNIRDFRFIRNDIKGYTVTESPQVLTSSQVDTTSRTNFYLREISPIFPLADKQAAVDEHTKDYLKEWKDPQKYLSLLLGKKEAPFAGYALGDGIKLIINRGRMAIDEFVHVVGMDVTFGEGVETARPLVQRQRS